MMIEIPNANFRLELNEFHPPFHPKSHNYLIIKKKQWFPKPLIPVQVRAGAPPQLRGVRRRSDRRFFVNPRQWLRLRAPAPLDYIP
jgi:hypothetical protein